MKKIQIVMLALAALGMVACGGGAPSKSEACGCETDSTDVTFCEFAWELCDAIGGSDGKTCKEDLKSDTCP